MNDRCLGVATAPLHEISGRNELEPRGLIVVHIGGAPPAPCLMFNAAKDALTSRAAQSWANGIIARYGQVQDVRIDSRLKKLEVTCLLNGESAPITIKIENYVVETDGDKKFVRATGFTCSRPWLQSVLTDFGPRQRVELPAWAAAAL